MYRPGGAWALSILMLLGLLAGFIAWQRWGPLAGIIVGFLFAGGLGWSILGAILNMGWAGLRFALNPRMYRQTGPFTKAWEARFGEIRPGREDTKPPPGAFQAWYRAWRKTGISAGDWLDAQMRR
jgi:hypothetical protein